MDPISVNILNIVGRVTERDKALGNVFALYNADWTSANAYAFQFGVQSQGQTFGVVRSMKVDNGSNPENVEVAISGTDDYFTIPAFSIGVYTVNANAGSTVTLTSQGGATDLCTITFYNYEVAPAVWYSFGAFNSDRPVKTYGTLEVGSTVAIEGFNNPVFIGGVDPGGIFRPVRTDIDGRVAITNLDVTIGGIFGAYTIGAPPANPGVLTAVLDSAGNVVNLQLNAAGEVKVRDGDVLAAVDGLEVKLDAIVENTDKAVTGTTSSVAAATADTVVLASNAARQGATIFNDSTAILYLLLSNAVATNAVYSVQIAAGGYYEVPAKYSGIIKGIWSAANGAARVTELV